MSLQTTDAELLSGYRSARLRQITAGLAARARRSVLQYLTRRALGALPDDALNDIGVPRCGIDAVARERC